MKSEMKELRKIVDLFEEAGFTVTYFDTNYPVTIAIKSESLIEIDDYKHEPATVADIAAYLGTIGYEIIAYNKNREVITKYGGTMYLEIILEGKAVPESNY
jgi:hypothetical protein